jgi:hypothetical protein
MVIDDDDDVADLLSALTRKRKPCWRYEKQEDPDPAARENGHSARQEEYGSLLF